MIKNHAVCVPCDQVLKYNGSPGTLSDHIHTDSCKVDPKVKEQIPKKPSKKRKKKIDDPLPEAKKLRQGVLKQYMEKKKKVESQETVFQKMNAEETRMFREKMLPFDLGVSSTGSYCVSSLKRIFSI